MHSRYLHDMSRPPFKRAEGGDEDVNSAVVAFGEHGSRQGLDLTDRAVAVGLVFGHDEAEHPQITNRVAVQGLVGGVVGDVDAAVGVFDLVVRVLGFLQTPVGDGSDSLDRANMMREPAVDAQLGGFGGERDGGHVCSLVRC